MQMKKLMLLLVLKMSCVVDDDVEEVGDLEEVIDGDVTVGVDIKFDDVDDGIY